MRLSRRVRPAVLAFALVVPVQLLLHAQEPPAPAGDPVHLDVVVTDAAGRPLPGLTPADFEVREREALQPIERVTFVSRPDVAGTGAPVRVFGILLDEFHVDPANTARVRDSLRQFVARDLRPDDLVVVVKPLDSLSGLQPASGRAALEERIDAFEGRKGDFEPRTAFEEATMSRAPAAAAPERVRVVLSALAALSRRLGALGDGRAALLFVSEGFAAGTAPRARTRMPDVQAIVETASRGDVAIYTIDPRPASPSDGDDPARSLLVTLAAETGGANVAGTRILEGLGTAARDLDGYYRVSYRPTEPAYGRHGIDVRVGRPGAQVRTPAARWAVPPPAESAEALPGPTFSRTRAPLRPQQISPLIDTWFGSARGAEGNTRMTFSWEPRTRAQTTATWLTFTAVLADGTVLFDDRVDPARAVGAGGQSARSATFEAPPGFVQVDMTIRDDRGALLGTDSRDVRVPDLRAPNVVISTPAIIRTLNALQFRTLSADPAAPPAVSRRFSRNERLLVRVHAYAQGDADAAPPEVSARLVGRGTATLRELAPLPDPPAEWLVQFDLPLSSYPSGEYGIEIRAGQWRELVLFEISN